MIEKDYVMRMIQQIGKSVAKVFKQIEDKKLEEAQLEAQSASIHFLGINFDLLKKLSTKGIIQLFTIDEDLDSIKLYIAAQLLFCDAKINNSLNIYKKSLELLLHNNDHSNESYQNHANDTIKQIRSILKNKLQK
ncbi:MAG: hypothetical protein COA79_20630 [Planctomycetota bacterium]|nr:MAG: hypothetical protein COA79_20630 [Planctomycetota bacterium]